MTHKCFKMKKIVFFFGFVLFLSFSSCRSGAKYAVTSAVWERIPVIQTNHPDPKLQSYVEERKHLMEAEMDVVLGSAEQDMMYGRPESLLTNFTSDAILQIDTRYTKGVKPDLAIVNVHGHRSPLAKGDITVGDIYAIYPFDNSLVLLSLYGKDLMDIFRSYAQIGGAGISGNARLVISNGQLLDAKLNGEVINPERTYHVLTLDYLAEGNDHMDAFKKAVSSEATGMTLRDYILSYVARQTREGKKITARLDGRITVK